MARAPHDSELISIVHRNIRALVQARADEEARLPLPERIADAITRFTGSMTFVVIHAVFFAGWITWNVLPHTPKFDPYPFVMLAMFASVEAIFLSTFVLISQNRMQRLADRRADLDLQINLLAEHEVTRVVTMVDAIARHLKVNNLPMVEELKQDVRPEAVLEELDREREEEAEEHARHHHPHPPDGHDPH